MSSDSPTPNDPPLLRVRIPHTGAAAAAAASVAGGSQQCRVPSAISDSTSIGQGEADLADTSKAASLSACDLQSAQGQPQHSRAAASAALSLVHEGPLSRPQRRARILRNESYEERWDEEDTATAPRHRRRTGARITKPDFYIDHSGKRVNRPARRPKESKSDYLRKYYPWLIAGNAVWTAEELDAAAAGATAPKDAHSSNDDEDSEYGMGDEDNAELDEGSVPAVTRGRRTLPDSYVDPRTSQVMLRPVRAVGEGEAAFTARYKRWRRRGLTSGVPGFESLRASGQSQSAAASAIAAVASAAPASSIPASLPLSDPYQMLMFGQLWAHYASQAVAGGAHAAVPLLANQLQAPAHAAAAAAPASAHPPVPLVSSSAAEDAMRNNIEANNASASIIPALGSSHSSAAQSSSLQRVPQYASSGAGAGSSLAATPVHGAATGSGKRKSASHDRYGLTGEVAAESASAAAAAESSGSPDPVSKKPRPSAIPILPPITFAPDLMEGRHPIAYPSPPSAASSSSAGSVDTSSTVRLAAMSSLELILAECISDLVKHAACVAAFAEADITLDDLERTFAVYFPDGRRSVLVDYGLITGGPCMRLAAIVRQRIEWKQQPDNECVEIKREDRAAGK